MDWNNCTAPHQGVNGVTGSNCFEVGSIQVEPSNVGVPDVINAGDNNNFDALAGFFTTTPGAGYMANVAMGNGGSATQSTVSLASEFGGGNPPFPGDVVTSFVYTLTKINTETANLVAFNYSFETAARRLPSRQASRSLAPASAGCYSSVCAAGGGLSITRVPDRIL